MIGTFKIWTGCNILCRENQGDIYMYENYMYSNFSRAYMSLPILYYNGHKLVFSIVTQRQLLLLIEIPQTATNPYVGCRSQTVVCISGRELRL